MIDFTLNHRSVTVSEDQNLLSYLRDTAELKSVKNGCAKGACGACTVLVNGKGVRACLLMLSKVAGKDVETVEGLSPREKEVYSSSFRRAGAVQCGFCIPGMVISAKALLNQNANPSREEVKKAIRGNICRCTGYVKIVDAILLSAEMFRKNSPIPADDSAGGVGESCPRIDADAKTLGTARYCDDIVMEGMLHAKVLRSAYPRAKVLSIQTEQAKRMPGVKAVLTAADIPGSVYDGYVIHDWPTLVPVGDCTRYIGDALALVAAETVVQAQAALGTIQVEYEVLKPVTDPEKAMQENAPKVHPSGNELVHVYINRNEPEERMAKSAHVVSGTYSLPFTDHAFMEPESSLAWLEDGILNVISGSQNVYSDQAGLCRILNLSPEKVRVRSLCVGGGFGGKEDMILQHHAALLALSTGQPVKLTFTREESLLVHPKRHAMRITLTLGADEQGNFTVLRSRIVADTGAYASMGAGVLRRACTHSCGPYRMPAVEMDGFAIYTNNPPAGAYRGFGVTQSCFALESVVDLMAEKLGMDRWQLRCQNALRPGDAMGPGQLCTPDTAIVETLEAVKPYYDEALSQGKPIGIACAIKNAGFGGGKPDIGRVRLKVEQGNVVLYTSAQCIGQGLSTVMLQIICETSGVPMAKLRACNPDTFLTPNASATTASRQTLVAGEATRRAAELLKDALSVQSLKALEGQEFYAEYCGETERLNDPDIENPKNHLAYSYATNLVILGPDHKIETVVAAYDVGRAINPQQVEGQIEGGVTMGLGYALTETFPLHDGRVLADYAHLGLLRSTDVPEILPIIVGRGVSEIACGAKGIGEISAIPIVPATASAYRMLDGTERRMLPLTGTPYEKNNSAREEKRR